MTGPVRGGAGDGGELLSAHLDGELDDAEAARVAEVLASDPAARRELDELARVRAALRGLGEVEPPAGFYEGLLAAGPAAPGPATEPPVDLAERRAAPRGERRTGRRRLLVGSAVAAAAAAVVVVVALVGVGDDDAMVPPVAEFAARHEAVAMHDGPADDGFEEMSAGELDAMAGPMAAPVQLAGAFERVAGFHDDAGTMHVVYGADDMTVSVYAQPGQVDFAALPPEGDRMEMDGMDAWLAPEVPLDGGTVEVLVLQRGGTAYTFVADAPHDDVMAVVDDLGRATGT